ncbi:hypothetical protein ACFPMF_09005 [Larkinella bovis]|uniref:DUF305 domain-containing protein n=1 Tax=Larkinella bovis TaxID=683041 RepID=A0ABW0IA84_9BACT
MINRKAGFRATGLVTVSLLVWAGVGPVYGQADNRRQPDAGRENRSEVPAKNRSTSVLMQPLSSMLAKSKAVNRTGDPDHDYAILIRIRDQAEAELLQQGMKTSKNPALVNTIQQLVAQKQQDGNDLRKITPRLRSSTPNPAFAQQIDQKLLAMELDLKNGMNGRLTDDPEKDFLTILTQHQQDSIDLTESYLSFAKDQALKAYAGQLLANRRKALETMKAMMKS